MEVYPGASTTIAGNPRNPVMSPHARTTGIHHTEKQWKMGRGEGKEKLRNKMNQMATEPQKISLESFMTVIHGLMVNGFLQAL